MMHRHLQVQSDTPAEELPSAAIVDILQRGDLADWQPIAAAVANDPNGELAHRILRLVNAYPMYGTSALWRSWIDRCRARAEGLRQQGSVSGVAQLRRQMGLTQVQLAGAVGMSQSDLSKFERRRDVRLSTLRAYLEALGGRLRVFFELRGRQTEVLLRSSEAGDGGTGATGTRGGVSVPQKVSKC